MVGSSTADSESESRLAHGAAGAWAVLYRLQ